MDLKSCLQRIWFILNGYPQLSLIFINPNIVIKVILIICQYLLPIALVGFYSYHFCTVTIRFVVVSIKLNRSFSILSKDGRIKFHIYCILYFPQICRIVPEAISSCKYGQTVLSISMDRIYEYGPIVHHLALI